jgi:hypothetical protein
MSETAKRMAEFGLIPVPGKPGCYMSRVREPRTTHADTTELRAKFEEWKLKNQPLPQFVRQEGK